MNEAKEPSRIWCGDRMRKGNDSAGMTDDREQETKQVDPNPTSSRSVFQHDYDRLLFSTPVRRLADKTQVWPMDENDGVRTRLTHSHEVANLARSIGARAYTKAPKRFSNSVTLNDTIQPMLMAIGLGHDLGNPPFGHQGEMAISNWFKARKDWIFTKLAEGGEALQEQIPEGIWPEFTSFDGNPQTLRLLTKLQTHIDGLGLDLSAATLAAGLKYPVHASKTQSDRALAKKGGYFESEREVVDWIRERTGLKEGQRHPLTWIMEACDDIAYSVLDVDDLLKKNMMSPDDVLVILKRKSAESCTVSQISDRFKNVEEKDFVPEIQRDIKIQYLRAFLIRNLVEYASSNFSDNIDAIFEHRHEDPLMKGSILCDCLQEIAQKNAFTHPSVLRMESMGAVAIDDLMSALWEAISDRKDVRELRSKRLSARSKYVFSLISPNYIEQAVVASAAQDVASQMRYRELRLLTDMLSGMTDTFAMKLWNDISAIPHVNRS